MGTCDYSDLAPSECAHCTGATIDPRLASEFRWSTNERRGVRIWPPTAREHETPGEPVRKPEGWAASADAGECRCGKPTRDAAYFCDDCGGVLTRALAEVPWVDQQLDTTITRQRAIPTEGGSRGTETPLPWHEKASDARTLLHGLLATWCRFCDEENIRHQSPSDGLPADTLPAMSRWLLWRVDGLALHDIGPEALDEITDALADCHRLIDRRPDRWYAGPCNAEIEEDVECGADLYAMSTKGGVDCRSCGASYDVAARRTWLLAAAEDRLADAATISRAVSWLGAAPLTAARVRKWSERKQIIAKGHDGHKPLYRIGDAIDLLANETAKAGA